VYLLSETVDSDMIKSDAILAALPASPPRYAATGSRVSPQGTNVKAAQASGCPLQR